MQVIRCTLRMGGGAENRPLVIAQHLEPALDIGGMIGARLRRQGKIATKERCAQLSDEFLAGIPFIAPPLAPEFTIKTAFVLRPVRQLVRQGRVVGFGATEALEMRHLHMIAAAAIVSPVPTAADVCTRGGEEFLGMVDPLRGVDDRLGLGIEMLGKSFDLLDIEHAIALHERDLPLFLAAIVLLFGLGDGVGINDQIAALALAHMRAQSLAWR